MGNLFTKLRSSPAGKQTPLRGGKETIIYPNGDRYEGETKNSQLNGTGIYYYKSGDIYEGEWYENKKNGRGTQTFVKDKMKYTGTWQDNEFNGEGIIRFDDGSYLQGRFVCGLKHGICTLYAANGDILKEEDWHYGKIREHSDHIHKEERQHSSIEMDAPKSTNSKTSRRDSYHSHEHRKNTAQSDKDFEKPYKSEGEDNDHNSDNDDKHDIMFDRDIEERNLLFISQNENLESGEGKAFDVGLETLNIIENLEMMNSSAGILNKSVVDWSI